MTDRTRGHLKTVPPRATPQKEPRPTPVNPVEDITAEVLLAIRDLRDGQKALVAGQNRIADVLAEILRRLTNLEAK